MANSNMRDFTSFNQAFTSLSTSARAQIAMRLLNASESIADTIRGLPTDYARAYAGVITQEYDSDNHVQDVTPEKPRSTVDYLIVDAKAKFEESVRVMESLKDSFDGSTVCTIPNDSHISYGVENINKTYVYIDSFSVGSGRVRISFDLISFNIVIYSESASNYRDREIPGNYAGYNRASFTVGGAMYLIICSFIKDNKIYSMSMFEDSSNGIANAVLRFATNYNSRYRAATVDLTSAPISLITTTETQYDGITISGATVELSNDDLLGLVDPTAMQTALNSLIQ